MTNSRIDILFKTITLLYRETLLEVNSDERSVDIAKLIISTLSTNNKNNQLIGGDSTIIEDLKSIILDMCDNPSNYDSDALLQSLRVVLAEKPQLLATVEKTITTEMATPGLKRSIIAARRRLYSYHKECELKALISKASYGINTGNTNGMSLTDFAADLANEIEKVACVGSGEVDPGIVNEFDLDSEEDVKALFERVSGENSKDMLLKTAWGGINAMLQGGFRRGAFAMIDALQHSYKSGFTRSMLAQFMMCNTPSMKSVDKKPLMIYISLEDDSEISMEFLYKYLYNSEHGKLPNMDEVTPSEAAAYVKTKLCVTGYNVKMLRVNPSEWTYKHINNKVIEYEAAGYEVHVVLVDYLAKLPTTGCNGGGITGADIRDMFNRVRNFMSA